MKPTRISAADTFVRVRNRLDINFAPRPFSTFRVDRQSGFRACRRSRESRASQPPIAFVAKNTLRRQPFPQPLGLSPGRPSSLVATDIPIPGSDGRGPHGLLCGSAMTGRSPSLAIAESLPARTARRGDHMARDKLRLLTRGRMSDRVRPPLRLPPGRLRPP